MGTFKNLEEIWKKIGKNDSNPVYILFLSLKCKTYFSTLKVALLKS